MTREKQIEEMAEAIFQNCNCGLFFSESEKIARFVIEEQGYRKQWEVTMEIFDEIEKLVSTNKKTVACATYEETIFYIEDFIEDLAELKKKYTGEKEDEDHAENL